MSQFAGDDTMSILDSINDGKHFVPKDTEPKPSMGWKKILAICLSVVVLGITVHILAVNSMSFAMLFNGIKASSATYFTRNAGTANGNRFSVFYAETTDGEPALVRAVENAFGFWRIDEMATVTDEQPWAYMAWKEPVLGTLSGDHRPTHPGTRYELVFIGYDALREIVVDSPYLPEDTAVYIDQSGTSYLIRLTGFDEKLLNVPVREILESAECVQKIDNETKIYIAVDYAIAYGNLQELTRDSDLIALVEIEGVVSSDVERNIPSTVFSAKVLKPIYNTKKGKEIQLYMTGGRVDGRIAEEPGNPLMNSGEQYLLFCRKNTDGTYTVLGGPQGRFVYEDGKLSSMDVALGLGEYAGIQATLDHAKSQSVIKEIKQHLSELDKT